MNKFIGVIKKFIEIKSDKDIEPLFDLLPADIKNHLSFYRDEMFVDYTKHYFYVFTSLLIYWAYDLAEKTTDERTLAFLNEMNDLFEYIDDEISHDKQMGVIEKTNELLKGLL